MSIVWFFPCRGIQQQPFASYVLPCQTSFCQTAPLLPSVTWQWNVMWYWWDNSTSTAIPATSTSNVVGKHDKIGSITFRVACSTKVEPWIYKIPCKVRTTKSHVLGTSHWWCKISRHFWMQFFSTSVSCHWKTKHMLIYCSTTYATEKCPGKANEETKKSVSTQNLSGLDH